MTKPLFNVSVSSVQKIHDMPGTWTDDDYRHLLTQLEVDELDDVNSDDLLDMTLMALQDMEAEDAADAVLAHQLGGRISAGARRNIVEDLIAEQRPWEEVSDIKLHASIFAAAVLLQKAFPTSYPKPDMLRVVLDINSANSEAAKLLFKKPEAAFVARMLADAMSENSILERLFDEQLLAHCFPEATGIIWQAEFSDQVQGTITSTRLTIYSSKHWLNAMESISEFQSNAYNDSNLGEKIMGNNHGH